MPINPRDTIRLDVWSRPPRARHVARSHFARGDAAAWERAGAEIATGCEVRMRLLDESDDGLLIDFDKRDSAPATVRPQ